LLIAPTKKSSDLLQECIVQFPEIMNLTVKDLGEQGLLPILQKYCPAEIIGDDGAILSLKDGYSLVVTTDVLVNNVHFSDLTTSPEDVGWRAAAANLSDLAAMGAEPLGITVGLALTPNLAIDWLEGLYRGLSSCLQVYQTAIVGGDVCRPRRLTSASLPWDKWQKMKKLDVLTQKLAIVSLLLVITVYRGLD
jgi:thiamine-monophosphate kinase